MNLEKADVERIVECMLNDLSIHVKDGDFTCPNERKIVLKYRSTEISTAYFDVVQKGEYEG